MARAVLLLLPALAVAAATLGCEENFLEPEWTSTVDTVTIYSLARPELSRESAYSFYARLKIRIEAAGAAKQWDVALDTRGGQFMLLPPGALGIESRARILALPGQSLSVVQEAPADTTLYSSETPLPVSTATTYVVRTDLRSTQFGTSCYYYAKMQPTALDPAGGSMQFIYDVSPVCNDRRLVPPDSIK